jgi:acyl-CoA thioesterase FadM
MMDKLDDNEMAAMVEMNDDRRKEDRRRKNEGVLDHQGERRRQFRRQGLRERLTARFGKTLSVRFKIDSPDFKGKDLAAVSRDIGNAGMFLEVAPQETLLVDFLKSKSYRINVEIQLPDRDVKVIVAAEVVRVNTDDGLLGKKIGLGLKFVEVSEDKKTELTRYLNELIKTDQQIIDIPTLEPSERKNFIFNKTLYLTDTNALGNAYFARYFDWQGMAREEFMRRIIPDPIAFFRSGMKIFTINASMEYKAELGLYDEIEIEVKTSNIKRASFELNFSFTNKNTSALIAVGSQRLAFVGPDGRIVPIPLEFKKKGNAYLIGAETK